MAKHNELSLEERIEIQERLRIGDSLRSISVTLQRAASTISREVRRCGQPEYIAQRAHKRAVDNHRRSRVKRKLSNPLFLTAVHDLLRLRLSPQQISQTLAQRFPEKEDWRVSHETIYTAVYLTPRGALRKELIAGLRQARGTRKSRARTMGKRGQILDMQSIHVRPPEVEARLIPGHFEGDLIKGAGNRSSVGTLVERTSGFLVLAKMSSATAADALEGFSKALETIPPKLRKTLTYDQGKEMAYHTALTLRTGVQVYFADPHSPWQRGSNENINGLIRQYLPKGTDLSVYSQDQLNEISLSLNTRPRKRHGWRTPLDVFNEHLALAEADCGVM